MSDAAPERWPKQGPWKPQPTLSNYEGWVVARLMLSRHEVAATVVQRIIMEWVATNTDALAKDFDIRREQFSADPSDVNFQAMRDKYCKK